MATIQFSYPSMTGTQAKPTDDFIFDSNDGFFSYTNVSGSAPKVFTPSKMFVTGNKLYIQHPTATATANVYVVFNLETDTNANSITTNNTTYINSLISDQLDRKEIFKIPCDITHKYATNNINNFSTDHIFEFPGNIKVKSATAFGTSTAPTISSATTTTTTITPLSFATDEIICDDATIDKSTNIDNYAGKVAGNIGLNIGVGISVIVGLLLILTKFFTEKKFPDDTSLFGWGDTDNNNNNYKYKGYVGLMLVFWLLSLACFFGYGGRMLGSSGPTNAKDSVVSSLLSSAIIFLIMFIIMVWYKVKYLTLP